jgi:hypothetical protein
MLQYAVSPNESHVPQWPIKCVVRSECKRLQLTQYASTATWYLTRMHDSGRRDPSVLSRFTSTSFSELMTGA